jgi:membrane-bound lytic murein transglycosylase F
MLVLRLVYPLAILFSIFIFTQSCSNSKQEVTDQVLVTCDTIPMSFNNELSDLEIERIINSSSGARRDLEQIKKDGVLTVVTMYSSTSYFLYKGQPMGYDFELFERIADHLGVELRVIVTRKIMDLLKHLHEGKADIVAYGLTVTERRKKFVSFTDPLYLSHQVLVQRKPEDWRKMKLHEIEGELITNNIELIEKTVSVRARSTYARRLINLMEEIGDVIYIDTIAPDVATEKIIKMVVDGEIDYTVADYNIASVNAAYYPELDIRVPISFSQRIAWSVRKTSPDLLEEVNNWLEKFKRQADFNVIYDRYFESSRDYRKRIRDDYYSQHSGKISPYDDLIKKYAAEIGWDWRLLGSQVYQESQFDPQAKSWAGAQGLMQLMPATAKEVGVTNTANPEENLKGGTAYLKEMWDKWETISDTIQRIKFAMASFNCGYYHVKDAVNLAEKDKADTSRWDDGVELYILKLSDPKYFNDPVVHYGYARGLEPYTYVFEIFERYEHYKLFVSK